MKWLPTAVALWLLILFSAVVARGVITGNFDGLIAMVPIGLLAGGFFIGHQAIKIVRETKETVRDNGTA